MRNKHTPDSPALRKKRVDRESIRWRFHPPRHRNRRFAEAPLQGFSSVPLFRLAQLHAIDLQAAREHIAENNQIVSAVSQFLFAQIL